MTDILQCATCPKLFPRGTLSAKRRNHCPDCLQERLRQRENGRRDAMDERAELLWSQKYAKQEAAYYGRSTGGRA